MTGNRERQTAVAVYDTAGARVEFERSATELTESDSDSKLAVLRLRERWELASVLNFLNVFEPVIGSGLKLSAEEIEMGLINPNSSLVKLHITLLKGIPPVSKTLNNPDSWVPALCKQLKMWWPWVAEGDIPLSDAKGEEASGYKELDPTTRLLILKALCEIRADQDDTASYLTDALKSGTEISCFRKDKIGDDGNGTTYWYDGNTLTGYRLYKEVKKVISRPKKSITWPFTFQWETLATNLEEFRKVMDEFSSSKVWCEMAVGKKIEMETIPALEKIEKKKELALKKKQRQESFLSYQHSYAAGITRSCRVRRPACYTFDEYDRSINEALHVSKKSKNDTEQKHEKKLKETEENKIDEVSNGSSDSEASDEKHSSMDSEDYNLENDDDDEEEDEESEYSHSEKENENLSNVNLQHQNKKHFEVHRPKGLRWSTRISEINNNNGKETRNVIAKNRSRVRPTRNTAIDSNIVPDSEDEGSENTVDEETSSSDTIDEEEQNHANP